MTDTSTFIQTQSQQLSKETKFGKPNSKLADFIFSDRFLEGLFLVIFAVTVPFLLYFIFFDGSVVKTRDNRTCLVKTGFRVSCGVVNITRDDCLLRNCCFDPDYQVCFHYLPAMYSYKKTESGLYDPTYERTPLGSNTIKGISVTTVEKSEDVALITLNMDGSQQKQKKVVQSGNFYFNVVDDPLIVEVKRNDDILLTTSRGPLIVSERYWEWTLHLTDEQLYGLGEIPIKLEENATLTKVIYPNNLDHTTSPVFWAYKNKMFHGIIIRHNGPVEITVLSSNLIVLRGIVNSNVEIEVAVGNDPHYLRQLQNNVTVTNIDALMQTHVCRSSKQISLTRLLEEYGNSTSNDFDNDCVHENLFDAMILKDEDDKDHLKNIIDELTANDKKFYLAVPPHIFSPDSPLYTVAKDNKMLYSYENRTDYVGKYLGQNVYYPHFNNNTDTTYLNEIKSVFKDYVTEDSITGFILTQNWPENEVAEFNNKDDFPYLPEDLETAMSNTIPWDAVVDDTQHIMKHIHYGNDMYTSFQNAFQDKVILTASNTFGSFSPQTVDNVDISWTNLKQAIKTILFNSAIGNYFIYMPICGTTANFNLQDQEMLCVRWYLIAGTLPTFMVFSDEPRRDPESLYNDFATQIVKNIMERRKSLIPYYKTIMADNKPLVTPMWYYGVRDNITLTLDEQYMLGENILVAHPFRPKQTYLNVYLPTGIWYEIWDGQLYNVTKSSWRTLSIIDTDWISFVKEGTVVALVNNMQLEIIVALTGEKNAVGNLLLEEGTLSFSANDVDITINASSIPDNYSVRLVKVYNFENSTLFDIGNVPITEGELTIPYDNPPTTTVSSTSTTTDESTTETSNSSTEESPPTSTGESTTNTDMSTSSTTPDDQSSTTEATTLTNESPTNPETTSSTTPSTTDETTESSPTSTGESTTNTDMSTSSTTPDDQSSTSEASTPTNESPTNPETTSSTTPSSTDETTESPIIPTTEPVEP